MRTASELDPAADRIAEFFPSLVIFAGLVMLLMGVAMLVKSRRHRGWIKQRAQVMSDAKQRQPVDLQFADGSTIRVENGSSRRLKPGKTVWAMFDPQNPSEGRTLPRGRTPKTQGWVLVATGVVITLIGVAVQIAYTAIVG